MNEKNQETETATEQTRTDSGTDSGTKQAGTEQAATEQAETDPTKQAANNNKNDKQNEKSDKSNKSEKSPMSKRFRGFLPVVVDVETGGLNPRRDALLEIAVVLINMLDDGMLEVGETHAYHISPFEGAHLDPASLELNKIDPYHPFRMAIDEKEGLTKVFKPVREAIKNADCQRAVLVGHNAWFDLMFMNAAVKRTGIKRNPFHPFTSFDTATLGGLVFGQTVLARALEAAKITFERDKAHSAIYDAEKTAELFCLMVNQWEVFKNK